MSGVIDELQAAGRVWVADWAQRLGLLALRAYDRMRGYEAMADTLRRRGAREGVFALVAESYRLAMAAGADALAAAERERRSRLTTVRDWLYSTLGELSDIDTHDVVPAGLGALQVVPAAVVVILAGMGLRAYLATMEQEDRDEERSYAHRQWLIDQCATNSEGEACQLAAAELAREHERATEGLPWWAWVLIALGLTGSAAGAVIAVVRR